MLKLPSKENIENQALQMELNEALQNEDKNSQDAQLVDELRAKVCNLQLLWNEQTLEKLFIKFCSHCICLLLCDLT